METGEVTYTEDKLGERVSFRFYVGPTVEGQPESARARALVHAQIDTDAVSVDIAAAELDRLAEEWLEARGLFNLEAFQTALAADNAAVEADPVGRVVKP